MENGVYKTAVILLSLNDDIAADILSMMKEEQVQEISRVMATLGKIDIIKSANIIVEFKREMANSAYLSGDIETTRKVLSKFLDKESVENILSTVKSNEDNVWDRLSSVNEELFASYLRDEHPQTIAVIFSKLQPNYLSRVMSCLPENLAMDVITRIINMTSIKKEALMDIGKTLKSEFITSFGKRSFKHDNYQLVAEMFNNMDASNEEKYLSMLDSRSPEASEKVRDLMFTFEDLVNLTPSSIQIILNNVDRKALITAMKGASDKVKDLILSNISHRAAKIISYELDSLGPVKVKEVSKAQSEILSKIKTLIEDNKVEIISSQDEYIS